MSSLFYVNSEELDNLLYEYTQDYSNEIRRILIKQGYKKEKVAKMSHRELRTIIKDIPNKPTIKTQMSEKLGEIFMKIATNLANKRNFARYTYKDDLISLGLEHLCRYAHNFDRNYPQTQAKKYEKFASTIEKKAQSKKGIPDNTHCIKCKKVITNKNYVRHVKEVRHAADNIKNKKLNPFAYISQICSNGFVQALNEEAGHSELKDILIKRNSYEHSEVEKWLSNEEQL